MAYTYAAYVGSGRITAVLNEALHENLYDAVGLRSAMTFYPYNAGASTTMNITTGTRGYAMAAATSETDGSNITATDPTTGQFQLTIARYGLMMNPTDLFHITGKGSPLDLDYTISLLTESLDLTLTDLLVGLFSSVAGNVGTTGVNMSTDDLYDAIFYLTLNNNTASQLMGVLHGQQCNDLMSSIRGETGPMQFRTDAQRAVGLEGVRRGDGFRFSFAGVDIHQCNSVATANSGEDRQGSIFAPGAFAYTLGNVSDMDPMVNPDDIVVGTSEMFVERNRDATHGDTEFIVNSYPGVAEAEDLRAVKVTTDA